MSRRRNEIVVERGRVRAKISLRDGRAQGWIEIDRFAVSTTSVVTASSVASRLNASGIKTRQRGELDGVRWMCLTLWRGKVGAHLRALDAAGTVQAPTLAPASTTPPRVHTPRTSTPAPTTPRSKRR